MREKLIELLGNKSCASLGIDGCDVCKYRYETDCYACAFADHLIANGVRLEEKQATSDESKWIPVTERLPNKSEHYLCLCSSGQIHVLPFSVKNKKFNSFDDLKPHCAIDCSHWMPLPDKPRGE